MKRAISALAALGALFAFIALVAWLATPRAALSPPGSDIVNDSTQPTPVPPPAPEPARGSDLQTAALTGSSPAAGDAADRPLPNVDSRPGGSSIARTRSAAVAEFRRLRPDVTIDLDPITESPKWIASNARLLTSPATPVPSAEEAVRAFIDQNAALFGHTSAVLSKSEKTRDYVTEHNGIRTTVWQQRFEGLDIFEAILKANQTPRGELINLSSQLVPSPETAAAASAPDRAQLLAAPPVSAPQAVALAAAHIGDPVEAARVAPAGEAAATADRKQSFRTARHTDVSARLVWVPLSADAMRPAWEVTLMSRTRGEMYRVLVDAGKSEVLIRQSLTSYISDASYRVFTTESPTPFSPGHETPSSLQPPQTNRMLITLPALNTTASPNGWINDGQTETNGNNVDAHTDIDNNNSPDLPRPNGGAGRVFDFPLDLTLAPSAYRNASVTQLFYWCNFMHDRMYEMGFTEAAGNFQVNNFGRGGLGNDPVQADAQDGSGTNNANFSTPADGSSGRMQMFLWTSPNPDRDGSFEAEVVLHEYGHGVSNRLVGGGVGISALSSRGMGEGWSDFYGLALTAEASENPHGNWARAGYSRYLTSGWLSENYYYGARRYSYSTDMLKNPHTFKDIDPTQVDWHTSVPRNPTYAATQDATQVHYQGTVWCVALWDLRANLILKHGFAIGNDRAIRLVTDGMKLSPANPNFIQARDGIVQATLVSFPADLGEVWTAFAKRGMGQGATAPASTTTTGVVESYNVPAGLQISDRSGWNITGNKGGPFTPATKVFTLSNNSGAPVNWSVNPNASWLSAAPASGTLAAGGNATITITSAPEAMAPGFHSTNIVFTDTATGFNQPIGVRLYVTPPSAILFDLATDPGWTRTGEWAFGVPAGAGGTASGGVGNPDPTAGATGSNVFGVNLAGNHSTSIAGPHYLTMGPVNLAARISTRLRFQRWLNTNALANTRTTVEVSTDGATWREVFVNPGAAITENAWRTMEYDISSIADQQPAVYVRWSYQTISAPGAYAGWNIDDVEFLGDPTSQFTLSFADQAAEGDGPITATLQVNFAQPSATTVALVSSNPSAATVPTQMTLPANALSATFAIAPQNDALLDGSQLTTISASAPGVATATRTLTIHDNETTAIQLTAPASLAEGTSGITGSVSLAAPAQADVTVALSSNHPALAVPASIVIPSGSAGPVNFTLSAPDNAFAEGPSAVTLTASVAGWTPGSAAVMVTDDETATLAITGPATAREGDGPQTFTATVNTPLASNLTIALTSLDTSEVTLPPSVTIPAGQFSATFSATITDDADLDGAQNVTLQATAAGYPNATTSLAIADNEVHHYTFAPIASPRSRNTAFPITITAEDLNGATITNHSGTVSLSSNSTGGPVPFTPATIGSFSNGVATAGITVTAAATAIVLTATDGLGRTGSSNAFDVVQVPLATFLWSGLPASATIDAMLTPTVAAKDDTGGTHAGYSDPTTLEAYVSYFDRTIGTFSSSNNSTKIYNTAAHDSRATLLYTAAELGGEKWIGNLVLSLGTSGGQSMSNFTIRVKPTALATLDGAAWDDSGWKTVYTSTSQSATTTTFSLTQPIYHDGVSNLLIDISFDNVSASTAGQTRFSPSTTNRVMFGTSNSTHGSPLLWNSATGPTPQYSTELPYITIYTARPVATLPASPATFTAGVWSGSASFPAVGSLSSGWLRATSPSGVIGFSNRVGLLASATAPAGSDIVFTDGFESGTTLGASWSTTGGSGVPRVAISSANTPRGTQHLQFDSNTTGSAFSRSQATLTLNLAGRSNVSVENFAKGFSEESNAATSTQPFPSATNFDGIAVSVDGSNWYLVRNYGVLSSTYSASATRIPLDPIFQQFGLSYTGTVRIKFVQYDDQAIPNDGIAIDDVVVRGNATAAIAVSLPPTVAEGSTNVSSTVTLPTAPVSNTTVALVSSAPARLIVPTSVPVLSGQTSATFTFSTPNDNVLDLGRPVYVTASASGQTTSITHTRITDNDSGLLTVTLPASITEGGTAGTGTVSVSPIPVTNLTVNLVSSNTAEATVTPSITIIAGSNSATFTVTPVNDTRIDGTQNVTITASGSGLTAGAASLDVLDNESTNLSLTFAPEIREGGTPATATIAIAGMLASNLSVNLSSSDLTEATVPASATILAGATSATFSITPVDDALIDGTQIATISASAPSFTTGSAQINVRDDEVATFEFDTIPSPQVLGVPIPVSITALDLAGAPQTFFTGTANLTATAGGTPATIAPTATGAFTSGVWTGTITVGTPASGAVVSVESGAASGSSEAFDVTTTAPVIDPEPAFTSGTENTIAWSAAPSATEYQTQVATVPTFADAIASPWQSALSRTHAGLSNGVTYHFRVRSRFLPVVGAPVDSPWSAPVSSTQDAAGPLITITSPLVSTSASYTLAGTAADLSGTIATLTVNGTPATTGNGFATWTRGPLTLTAGMNLFTIAATDSLSPANTSALPHSILLATAGLDTDTDGMDDLYEATHGLDPLDDGTVDPLRGPLGDLDRDGLRNLLEYAFNSAADVPDHTGRPSTALAVNPADGERYPTITYRRRIAPGALEYFLEVSTDLDAWTEPAPAQVEQIGSPTPQGDGVTESVQFRLKPSFEDSFTPRYLRVGVRIR